MRFRVTLDGVLVASSGKIEDDARRALWVAMEELSKLGQGGNAAIDLVSSTGQITISCAVESDTPVDAIQPASDNIYLALRHGNIATGDWPDTDDACWHVEFINSRAEALVAAG